MDARSKSVWLRATDKAPAAELPRAGRIAAAAALVLGSGCQVIAFLLSPKPAGTTQWLTDVLGRPVEGHLVSFIGAAWVAFTILNAQHHQPSSP